MTDKAFRKIEAGVKDAIAMTQEKAVPVVGLKACPFCGSEQVTTSPCETITDDERPEVTWCAICKACSARVDHDFEAEAIAAWNTRPGEQQAATIAEVREAFLDMIADARDWHDEPDGDETGDHTTLHLITHHSQMGRLIEALGIKPRYCETVTDAIDRALDRELLAKVRP